MNRLLIESEQSFFSCTGQKLEKAEYLTGKAVESVLYSCGKNSVSLSCIYTDDGISGELYLLSDRRNGRDPAAVPPDYHLLGENEYCAFMNIRKHMEHFLYKLSGRENIDLFSIEGCRYAEVLYAAENPVYHAFLYKSGFDFSEEKTAGKKTEKESILRS